MDELTREPALTQGTATGDLARAIAFLHAFAHRKAPVRRPVPGGFAVLDDRYPGSYDDNKLIIRETPDDDGPIVRDAPDDNGRIVKETPGDDRLLVWEASEDNGLTTRPAPGDVPERAAELLMAVADETLATRAHRLACIDDDQLGTACVPAFAAAGYEHETNLVMVFRGPIPTTPPSAPQEASQIAFPAATPAGLAVVEVLGLEEVVAVSRRDWRESLPEASDETIDALARRVEVRLRGADTVGFRGVRAPDGEIAARADLYVHGGVAQIESVLTAEAYRGKGYARTLMYALLAEVADAELIFLVADADDWPRHFYTRLGFETVGRTHAFLRT
ncbi:GNAT family N-acetyltransferase [Nonomuraea fuscirosea]|uniref:GNAT family N-acetyltransferase n=1 Tax=Nonomuraea fuscirosea TaxID=1291556 RepID=UPI003722B285